MKRRLTKLASACLLVVAATSPLGISVADASILPKIYYVDSTSGHNGAAGTTPVLAWKTIARVNTAILLPGDQVLFKRGGLWREQLTVDNSGTAGSEIVFGAYGTGPAPVLSAAKCVSAGCTHGANRWSLAGATTPIYRSAVKWKAGVFIYPGLVSTIAGVVIQDSIVANNALDGVTVGYNTATTQIERNLVTNNDYGIIFYDPQNQTATGGNVIDNDNAGNIETGLCFFVPNSSAGLVTAGNTSPEYCPATLAQHALLY